ncbi:hypothetical protein G5V57_10680 [Nordella sp. HKS 07]|uniref:hypothetical protein n=1 Tax=Nordella sp. HKS 07 TaxID=2712222 RepID=UPI0013E17260|nr:hypothetical protein [Nordella sp. HKS 07]QIG48149.1 hypothetical protein G5V57_10680 [Nordella sp. HKS 07]
MLQRKLYSKAKAKLGFRFYQLCDKIWRAGMLAHGLLRRGCTDMVDADLSKDVDTFPHAQPMPSVARRIVDRQVRDRDGTERMNGGKDTDRATPQGGVISSLLANLCMNRFLKHWQGSAKGETFRAHISVTQKRAAGQGQGSSRPGYMSPRKFCACNSLQRQAKQDYLPSCFSQRAASRATFFGAVPPRLVREATEFSTDSTL